MIACAFYLAWLVGTVVPLAHSLQHGQHQVVVGDEEAAFGGVLRGQPMQVAAEFGHGDLPGEGLLEDGSDLYHLVGRFMGKFQAQMVNAGPPPGG